VRSLQPVLEFFVWWTGGGESGRILHSVHPNPLLCIRGFGCAHCNPCSSFWCGPAFRAPKSSILCIRHTETLACSHIPPPPPTPRPSSSRQTPLPHPHHVLERSTDRVLRPRPMPLSCRVRHGRLAASSNPPRVPFPWLEFWSCPPGWRCPGWSCVVGVSWPWALEATSGGGFAPAAGERSAGPGYGTLRCRAPSRD